MSTAREDAESAYEVFFDLDAALSAARGLVASLTPLRDKAAAAYEAANEAADKADAAARRDQP